MAKQSKPVKITLSTADAVRGLLAVKPDPKPKKATSKAAKKPKKG